METAEVLEIKRVGEAMTEFMNVCIEERMQLKLQWALRNKKTKQEMLVKKNKKKTDEAFPYHSSFLKNSQKTSSEILRHFTDNNMQ